MKLYIRNALLACFLYAILLLLLGEGVLFSCIQFWLFLICFLFFWNTKKPITLRLPSWELLRNAYNQKKISPLILMGHVSAWYVFPFVLSIYFICIAFTESWMFWLDNSLFLLVIEKSYLTFLVWLCFFVFLFLSSRSAFLEKTVLPAIIPPISVWLLTWILVFRVYSSWIWFNTMPYLLCSLIWIVVISYGYLLFSIEKDV